MKTITIKQMKQYFKDEDLKCRHNLTAFKYGINTLNKEVKTDAYKLFMLIVENRPIDNLHTHSYNFHTRNGRYLIDTFSNLYYNKLNTL
jgi:hypothetical protein